MQPIATAAQVRAAEDAWCAAHPGREGELMQRAAAAVAEAAGEMLNLSRRPAPHTVLVLAGSGNNAGDALYAAAQLAAGRRGQVQLLVWTAGDRTHPEGLRAALAQGAMLVSKSEVATALTEASLVIDGLFGMQGRSGLTGACAEVAQWCAQAGVEVLAVDLPSGLAADSAEPGQVCLRATRTVTFIARHLVHVSPATAEWCGMVQWVDLGVRPTQQLGSLWTPADVAAVWPMPGLRSDKYSRGVVGLDVGSQRYPGAGVLAALGASHSGAGMVRLQAPPEVSRMALDRVPSLVTSPGRVQAWVCGSGWGDGGRDRLQARVDEGLPMVIDADALAVLDVVSVPPGSLLTPHAGELARLLGVERQLVESDPIGQGRIAAEQTGAVVLVKGSRQFVVGAEGEVAVAVPGPAWTAQAGSGDVLAGVCGTLLAAGLDPLTAGVAAASVQAMTATRHPGPWPPHQVASWLPETIAALFAPGQLSSGQLGPG